MQEVYRTNNAALLSYIEAVFQANEIQFLIADQFSSIMEGSIGAIQRRVLVVDDDVALAEKLIGEMEAEHD